MTKLGLTLLCMVLTVVAEEHVTKLSLDGSLLLVVGSPIWEPPASSGEPNLGSPLLAGI